MIAKMKTINSYLYPSLLVFLFCNPICAQNNKKTIKVGKIIFPLKDTISLYHPVIINKI